MAAGVTHGAGMATGFYTGASYLKVDIDGDEEGYVSGVGYYVYESDDDSSGYRVNLGWRFHPHVAAELSYIDASDLEGEGNIAGVLGFDGDFETKQAAQLSVLANTALIKERVAFYAKLGYGRWDYKVKVGDLSDSDDDSSITYGAGALFAFNDRWTARLEFDRWKDLEGYEVDVYSLGIQYRWGQ